MPITIGATDYITQTIDKSMEREDVAHSTRVHHDKLIALANILHYQAGVEKSTFSSTIDSPSRKLKADEAKNIEKNIKNHQANLINWAKEESIAQDINYIARRAGVENDVFARRYLKNVVGEIYRAVLSGDNASLQNAVKSLYNQIIPKTGKPLVNEIDADKIHNDAFGFMRGNVPPANMADYFKSKITDNILNTIELAFAKQISIQHDINLLKMTTGNEILYRGIPAVANDRADIGMDSFRDGISHARISKDKNQQFSRNIFDFGIRSKWWNLKNNTQGDSTTPFVLEALHFATGNAEKTGYIYVSCPPAQKHAVSAGQYMPTPGRHAEITLVNIESSCIKERVKVKQLSKNKYVVLAVEPNPFFDKTLYNSARKDTELKRGDILKDGAKIKCTTTLPERIKNSFIKRLKNRVDTGAKLKKHYTIEHSGKVSEYKDDEQNELYNKYYRKSDLFKDKDHERRTSKHKPKYNYNILQRLDFAHVFKKHYDYTSKDFNKHYTPERLRNYRFGYHHPIDSNISKLNKSYETTFDILEPLGKLNVLAETIATLKDISADYCSTEKRKLHHIDKSDDYRNKIADTIFSNSYKNLSIEEQSAVRQLTEIAIKRATVTATKVQKNNADVNLKKGIYGGIGAEGSLTTRTIGGVESTGFLISKTYENGAAEHKGLKAGTLITAIGNENVAGMSLEQFVAKMRGQAGERVTIKFIDANGKQDSTTLSRDIIDATYQEKYNPTAHVKAAEAAKKQLPANDPVRLEYQNRAINGVKYYVPNTQTALDDITKQNIRTAKQSFKENLVNQHLSARGL